MSEVDTKKNLYGLGGWLVLFQIQIFSTLASMVQMIIMFIISGVLIKSEFVTSFYSEIDMNPFDIWAAMNSPIAFVLTEVVFVLTLLCVIYFYRKKLVFRTFFIIESVINIGALCVYIYVILNWMSATFAQMTGGIAPFTGVFAVFYLLFTILPVVGIAVAFIIALYKSKRVKNTFN